MWAQRALCICRVSPHLPWSPAKLLSACRAAGSSCRSCHAATAPNAGSAARRGHGGAARAPHSRLNAAGMQTAPGLGSGTASAAGAMLPVVYHPLYSAPRLAHGHRFPMQVFERIYQRLLGSQLVREEQVHVPPALPDDATLGLVHTEEYLQAFNTGSLDEQRVRRIGFGDVVHSQVLIDRTKAEVAGTLLTARLALKHGLAVNTAGGTHHAHPGFGSGFCILNDLAVTTKVLLAEGAVQRVMIVDLDVHQGDGTAVCLADEPRAFTLSVHCESNFPARKARSTLDVGLPDGTADAEFLAKVADVLPSVLADFRPDLVLYDAGVDVHVDDSLGRLAVTDEGLARREALVLDTCLAAGVPVAGYVGGGYAPDLDILADRHIHLHRAAQEMWRDYCTA